MSVTFPKGLCVNALRFMLMPSRNFDTCTVRPARVQTKQQLLWLQETYAADAARAAWHTLKSARWGE